MLLTSLSAHAADIFSAPARAPANTAAVEQDDRIARLEKSLGIALEKLEHINTGAGEAQAGKTEASLPPKLPASPLAQTLTQVSGKNAQGALADAALNEERVLGEMNGSEIYVSGGVVRKRAADARLLPPVPKALVQ